MKHQNYDTIILGAGAAGLMCALTAGQRGRKALLLDHAEKAGKKSLFQVVDGAILQISIHALIGTYPTINTLLNQH